MIKSFRRSRAVVMPCMARSPRIHQARIRRDLATRSRPDTIILINQILEQKLPRYEFHFPTIEGLLSLFKLS